MLLTPSRPWAHTVVMPLMFCTQICHEFTRFSARMKVKIANFYGGVPVAQNKEQLKKEMPNVVVGTPGRIKQVRFQEVTSD